MIYLSIVVPVYNEERFIRQTLKMLANQDYPPDRFEIIVVDGTSQDGTCNVVEQFMKDQPDLNIRLLKNSGRLSSCARNIGIRESKGKLIGVIDGHVYIPNGQLFANMERLKEENNALCLARPAPLDVPGLTDGISYWIAVARKSWLGHSRNSYIYSDFEGFVDPMSSGFAYDRSVFEKVGHFDESFDAAEDVEFHFRLKQAGIMAYTSPDLLIYSYPRESLSSLFRQQMRYGIGRARLIKKHRSSFTKETPFPSLILIFFVIWLISLFFYSHFSLLSSLFTIVMIIYWLILLGTGFREAVLRRRVAHGILIALTVWTTHMGLGWGFLKTIFKSGPLNRK